MVYIPQDYIRLSGFTNSAWDCLAVDAQLIADCLR